MTARPASTGHAPPPMLGFWSALAIVMGCMIGSGVLLLPANLAPFGWNSVLGWGLTIIGCVALAAVFGEMARVFPQAGGPYVYTEAAFGPQAAFVTSWALWATYWIGNAAIVIGGVSYMSHVFPALGGPGTAVLTSIVVIWLLTLLNIVSVSASSWLQIGSSTLKVIPLVAVAGLAIAVLLRPHGAAVVLPYHAADVQMSQIARAAPLCVWAMLGFEGATIVTGKVRNPARNVPLATIAGTAAAGVIYLFVCSAVVLMLPPAQTAHSPAPFADFVARFGTPIAGNTIAIFGAICALGAVNGGIIVQAELPAAMARGGQFPKWLAVMAPNGAPVGGHLVSSTLITVVLLLNSTQGLAQIFETLILLTVALEVFVYLVVALAAARLLLRRRIALTPTLAIVTGPGIIFAVWAIYSAGRAAVGWGAILLLAAVPFLLTMRHNPDEQPL